MVLLKGRDLEQRTKKVWAEKKSKGDGDFRPLSKKNPRGSMNFDVVFLYLKEAADGKSGEG